MSPTEIVVRGALGPDGTLHLDKKPNLPPGPVTVVLRPEAPPQLPPDDPFWQRMQAIWGAQQAAGHVHRSAADVEAERRRMRDEWEDHQQALERLQEAGRTAR